MPFKREPQFFRNQENGKKQKGIILTHPTFVKRSKISASFLIHNQKSGSDSLLILLLNDSLTRQATY